jgi:Xaa-Pro aminopeptidase
VNSRISRFQAALQAQDLPAALIQSPLNVAYLSGFTGSTAVVLATPTRAAFITDCRYAAQAQQECPGFEHAVTQPGGGYADSISGLVQAFGLSRVAIEADHVTLAQREGLAEKLPEVDLLPVKDLVSPLRRVKDAEELRRIRAACGLVDAAFDWLVAYLRPGLAEREVAIELEYWLKKAGSEKEAFDTIVASGHRSAMPHGRASGKLLERGDFVTIDFGARVEGYHSDLTRTFVLGPATEKQREVYEVVLAANRTGVAAVRAGVEGKAVDAAARAVIDAAGYGAHFGHGLGHGLGLHVHDHPAFGLTSTVTLEAGMVATIEPGVYLDGWGGVRIEDDVLVTEEGCEVLTHAPRELLELG